MMTFLSTYVAVVWYMVLGHFVADYPLQTDFLAKGKSPLAPPGPVPWYYIMAAHAAVHALAVNLVAGMFVGFGHPLAMILGGLEGLLHFYVDLQKCLGHTNIHADQGIHLGCKLFHGLPLAVYAVIGEETWPWYLLCALVAFVFAGNLLGSFGEIANMSPRQHDDRKTG